MHRWDGRHTGRSGPRASGLLPSIKKGLQKVGRSLKKQLSLGSVVAHLALPFFLAAGTPYLPILTVAQQAEANAARAKTEATRPGEN